MRVPFPTASKSCRTPKAEGTPSAVSTGAPVELSGAPAHSAPTAPLAHARSADLTSWINGKVGIDRVPTVNALEVDGAASKTTAGSWLANSDRRIKTQVHTITNALETISRIRPVAFRYTDEYRKAHACLEDTVYYNVIAQEFAEVFPHTVTESGDKLPGGEKILQVDTYPATIHALAAIQELHRAVKEKDERIVKLEDANRNLEARLSRLERALWDSSQPIKGR